MCGGLAHEEAGGRGPGMNAIWLAYYHYHQHHHTIVPYMTPPPPPLHGWWPQPSSPPSYLPPLPLCRAGGGQWSQAAQPHGPPQKLSCRQHCTWG